ncbi:MAG: DUF418 domain-containing protein [Gammaproteobacteria bacterium]|jgi:uncharacterized protein|nr:DUF418 domain-containing protein [Gammaproteobacteria bacterium]
MACMPADVRISPTDPQARLRSVDAVRGFALFGVMLVNMYNFGAYAPEWTGSVDRAFSTLMHSVFETKSWRLFSLLFGFGFALQLAKVMSQTVGSLWFYFRRVFILFVFGMVHALFYDGDILMEYAALGLILVVFRNVRSRTLLILAFVLMAAFPVGNLIHTETAVELAEQAEDELSLAVLRMDHPFLGSPMDVFRENALAIPPRIWSNLHGPESSLAIFSMFLLGLYVGRARILHESTAHLPLIRQVFAWGIGFGAVSALAEWILKQKFGYAVFMENTASDGVRFVGDVLFAYGSTALALGYGAGIVLLARRPAWEPVLRPLQNMGKMALTVYLSGTALFTTLFYGYGFGQAFLLGPAAVTMYAILFFTLQLLFCNWWLGRFRFGPAEWLWRSLTYLKIQPLRL